MAVFVISAELVLRPFVATTALVGAALLVKDDLGMFLFFMFLLVVSACTPLWRGRCNTLPPLSAPTAT